MTTKRDLPDPELSAAGELIGMLERENAKLKRELEDARKKNAELAVFVEAFCEVCEAHAGTSGESVSDLLDKALELEMWQQ